jgi:GGDEF domain-containing protein
LKKYTKPERKPWQHKEIYGVIMAIIISCAVIMILQATVIYTLSQGSFGVLSPAALRLKLWAYSLCHIPCAVFALDIRKLHELNTVFGYSQAGLLVQDLVRVRLLPGRVRDFIGQYGGDEFVAVVVTPRAAESVKDRILQRAQAITDRMTPEQRETLLTCTGGLVDGLHVAMGIVSSTTDAAGMAKIALDQVNAAKSGAWNGSRATSGQVGTIIVTVK